MVIKVGINGFGRIGRIMFRTCFQESKLEISAINDPAIDIEYICYLIKFDSTHGKFIGDIVSSENNININGRIIKIFHKTQPSDIPWQTVQVQYVIEASGMFTNLEKSSGHLASESVRRVIITAPSVDVPMFILGVNDDQLRQDEKVISCASSTLYCLAPIMKVLEDNFGVAEGFVTSIHAMTPSLKPLDGLCLRGQHWRDHRSIHQNIIPATTGVCKALGKILPQSKDKISGLAFRVPIVNVSVLDLTIRLTSNTMLRNIVKSVEIASQTTMKGIIKISNEEAVSSDFMGDSHSCTLDVISSLQLKPNFFKLVCWYENELSYACRVIDTILFSEKQFDLQIQTKTNVPVASTKRELMGNSKYFKQPVHVYGDCSTSTVSNLMQELPSLRDNYQTSAKFRPTFLKKYISADMRVMHRAQVSENDTKERVDKMNISENSLLAHSKKSVFQSCISFETSDTERKSIKEVKNSLDNVTKEINKMLNITENLVTKSHKSTFNISGRSLSSKGKIVKGVTNKEMKLLNDYPNATVSFVDEHYEIMTKKIQDLTKDNQHVKCEPNRFIENKCVRCFRKRRKTNMNYVIINKMLQCMNSGIIHKNKNTSSVRAENERQIELVNIREMDSLKDGTSSYEKCFRNKRNNIIKDLTDSKRSNIESQSILFNTVISTKTSSSFDIEKSKQNINCNNDKDIKNYDEDVMKKEREDKIRKKDEFITFEDTLKDDQNIIQNDNSLVFSSDENIKENYERLSSEGAFSTKGDLGNKNTLNIKHVDAAFTEKALLLRLQNVSNASNARVCKIKEDIYDKLDSTSVSDSDNSFNVHEKKSQVLTISDLTNSLDDLARLEKICEIIEISDELSDELFSGLREHNDCDGKNKNWSFKELCDKIKLDEFCSKVFGESSI